MYPLVNNFLAVYEACGFIPPLPLPTVNVPTLMTGNGKPSGGENFSLRDILLHGRKLNLHQRTAFFSDWIQERAACGDSLYGRTILSHADRQVRLFDTHQGCDRSLLMFGSNNYLGLANHPHVRRRVQHAIDHFGVGIGGPPLLNGYTRLHEELEARLAAFKNKEAALLFSSGYGTNVGLVSALASKHDLVLHDAYSHASFHDGLKMSNVASARFPHNDVAHLETLLSAAKVNTTGEVFVGVEGVYSMDGDLAPLDQIAPLCQEKGAILLLDDAHGTGVMGPKGQGTDAHFGVEDEVDIVMGTFSKAFGVTGGFVAASEALVDYMRYFARSYFFSASLPPMVVAAVLGGLEVLEQEPERRVRLHENVRYLTRRLRAMGFAVNGSSAIIPLLAPVEMDLRKASFAFHQRGIFLNSVEYPAVPSHKQRFRVSVMATHRREDLDRLLEVIEEVWALHAAPRSGLGDPRSGSGERNGEPVRIPEPVFITAS